MKLNKALASLFARRYLLSAKSHSIINIISIVSCVAVGVPVAAMVILMSVFNGFESLVKGLYSDFDADFLISPRSGKVFEADSAMLAQIRAVKGVEAASVTLEDNAMVQYYDRQQIATIRGVDSSYRHTIPIEKLIVNGVYQPLYGDEPQAIVGRGIAYSLGINSAILEPVKLFTPRRVGNFSSLLPIESFSSAELLPAGVFALDAESDGKYILVPIEFAQSLFDYKGKATGVMVKAKDNVKAQLEQAVGEDLMVMNRFEQKATIYTIMKYEKWALFFVALLVMIIASFSIVGSITMLIIDKRPESQTLITMGATRDFLRRIFVTEGLYISMIGTMGGLTLGLAVSLAQQYFGIVKIPASSLLIESYPVLVIWSDIALILLCIGVINYIISKFTVRKLIR